MRLWGAVERGARRMRGARPGRVVELGFVAAVLVALFCARAAAVDPATGLELETTIDLGGRPIGRPVAIAAGPLGGVYLADAARGNVLRLDADGTVLFEFESPPGQPGLSPLDIAVVGFKVYVLDAQSGALLRYGEEGAFLDVLKSFDPARGEMPRALSVDTTGRVVLVQTNVHRVSLLDESHRVETVVGGFGSRTGELVHPSSVAFADDGSFYVCDTGNRRIQRFGAVGNFEVAFGDSLREPRGLAVARSGELVVADPILHALVLFGPTGMDRAKLVVESYRPIDVALVGDTVWALSASPPALLRARVLRGR